MLLPYKYLVGFDTIFNNIRVHSNRTYDIHFLISWVVKMKKFLLLIITLILSVTVSMPYGVSLLLSREYKEDISRWNANNSKLEISGKFTVGLFTSSAKTTVKTKANNRNNIPLTLELEHTIKNGPVIIDFQKKQIKTYKLALIETKIINKGFQEVNKQFYKDQQGVEIITELEYKGNGVTKIKNLPFIKDVPNGQVEWGGAEFTIKHDRLFTVLNHEILMPKLSYREGINLIELQKITSKGEQRLMAIDLWDGYTDFQFKQFNLKSNIDDVFTMSGFKFNSKVDINNSIVHLKLGWKIESIFELASISKVGPLTLAINVENIDGEALYKLQKFGYLATNDPAMLNKINEVWRDLFLKKIKVKLNDTEFNLLQGKLTIEAEINVGGARLKTITPPIVMQTVDGIVKIEMPKALAYEIAAKKIECDIMLEGKDFNLSHEGQSMPKPYKLTLVGKKEEIEKRVLAEIKKLVDEKFIIEKEKTFFTEITMKDSIINVNSKPLLLGL